MKITSSLVFGINIFGTIVSLFSVYVTYSLYRKYKLANTLFFIVTSFAILVWNSLHLILNFIGPEFSEPTVRNIWVIVVIAGIIFVFSILFGYSTLRYENINWRLILYGAIAAAFTTLFIWRPDWVTVRYQESEGWVTYVQNQTFWSLFAITIFIVNLVEIIIPLVDTYARIEKNRNILLIMLGAILLSIFSNALEPVLTQLDFPQAFRFLIADFGFLIFFIILLKYPFIGLYDHSTLNQVIIAGSDGVPRFMLTDDATKAILASGAMISINAILEEMTKSIELLGDSNVEGTRKIELGKHQFFIIIKKDILIIFQFENPSGVCYAKFKSLSKLFDERGGKSERQLFKIFKDRVEDYFSDFDPEEVTDIRILGEK